MKVESGVSPELQALTQELKDRIKGQYQEMEKEGKFAFLPVMPVIAPDIHLCSEEQSKAWEKLQRSPHLAICYLKERHFSSPELILPEFWAIACYHPYPDKPWVIYDEIRVSDIGPAWYLVKERLGCLQLLRQEKGDPSTSFATIEQLRRFLNFFESS